MGIVIAFIIIVAAYIGYYASQDVQPEGETHGILLEPQTHSFEAAQIVKVKVDQAIIR